METRKSRVITANFFMQNSRIREKGTVVVGATFGSRRGEEKNHWTRMQNRCQTYDPGGGGKKKNNASSPARTM